MDWGCGSKYAWTWVKRWEQKRLILVQQSTGRSWMRHSIVWISCERKWLPVVVSKPGHFSVFNIWRNSKLTKLSNSWSTHHLGNHNKKVHKKDSQLNDFSLFAYGSAGDLTSERHNGWRTETQPTQQHCKFHSRNAHTGSQPTSRCSGTHWSASLKVSTINCFCTQRISERPGATMEQRTTLKQRTTVKRFN